MTTLQAQEILDKMRNVRPEKLNDEAKKIFAAIMTIADERDKYKIMLKEEREKNTLLTIQLNGAFDRGFISKDKIKEKIEEIEKEIEIEGLSEKDNDLIYTPYDLYKYAQINLKQLLEEV